MKNAGITMDKTAVRSAVSRAVGGARPLARGSLSLILAAFVFLAPAQHKDAGTAAFPFLAAGYDARSAAMGGASAAVPNDLYGAMSNPASVGYIKKPQIMGGYRQIIMDVWGGPLGIAVPAPKGVTVAPHLISLTAGEFDIIDESGLPTGLRARSSYTAFGVAAAKMFGDVSAGAAIKGIYHYIGAGAESYSADGFAADLGAQYRAKNGRLIYGAALRNWGFVRSGYLGEWNEHPMPYGAKIGVSYVPRHITNLRAAVDASKYNGDYLNFEPGFEYAVLSDALFIRGGYAFSSADLEKMLEVFRGERDSAYQKSGVSTLSLGIGMAAGMDDVDLKLDAAIVFNSGVSAPSFIMSVLVVF
jgi:hypothetical protein